MSAGIDGAEERREKDRAAVIARLAAKLLPRARAPRPPPQPVPVSQPLPSAAFVEVPASGQWRSSCDAINPDTGRRCCLLAGHAHAHRHGRTDFYVAAAPSQKHFPRAAALTTAATSRHGVDPRAF